MVVTMTGKRKRRLLLMRYVGAWLRVLQMRPSPPKEPNNPSPPQHRPLNRCQTGVWHYLFCFSIIRYKRIGFTGNSPELDRNPSSLTVITVGDMAAIDLTSTRSQTLLATVDPP
ncbi:hypothetical protein HanPSC8_Chr05g0219341 [Helianthus annuus]|nr:hypothetical protein HanPSC8_Chr05g0219341 [Helianthus annuus]